MRNYMKCLEELSKILDVENFYAIAIYKDQLKLQGKATRDNLSTMKILSFEFLELDVNNHLQFQKDHIFVTLTPNE